MKKPIFIFTGLAVIGIFFTVMIVRQKNGGVSGSSSGWIKPVEGKITSKFGLRIDPLPPHAEQGHNGVDIAVPSGTQVKAPRAGVVKIVNTTTDGGNQIVIQHDNGWFTGYAHLSKQMVKVGQKISQGQIIALSGATGAHITGPHLHFTLTNEKGNKVDPQLYVYR